MADAVEERAPGIGIVNVTFAGTGAVVVTSVAASLLPDTFGLVHAALSCVLFAVGTGALLWAYALGVSRSRTDAVTLGGLFFLADGTAPPDVRRPFRVALAVEVVAVVAAAAIHPFTQVAFGILAPMFALGLMGMWGGRYGTFGPREPR
ncbi:MAG TPA: hypothetical protein VIR58_06420 [Acidimicrobiales bacterium]